VIVTIETNENPKKISLPKALPTLQGKMGEEVWKEFLLVQKNYGKTKKKQ
jgi:hypothetical protein